MTEQWAYWTAALKGEFLEDMIERGKPQSGFYRDRQRAVAIWRDEDGRLCCAVSAGYKPIHPDEIDELFGWVCRKPITRDQFIHIRDGGAWPEDVEMPAIGDNSDNRPLSEIIAGQIETKKSEMEAWLKQIGGEIATEAHATKAANYADLFQKLWARAEDARKAEKRPLDEQVAEIQSRWNPVLAAADASKRWIKGLWEGWGRKELQRKREEDERRRQEALAAHAEEARLAEERGETAPELELPAPERPRASAGTRGRVSMRTRKVVQVTDQKAMLAFFASMDNPPPELVEIATKLAKKLLEGGSAVPGASLKDESYAA